MRENRPTVIPQTDPKAGYLVHQAEIESAIQRVLNSGWYILGREVESFEQEFAAYIGVRHAIGVANGTDALELSLRACDVGPGDLVFTVSHTAVATVAAIELAGATPVLVDIDPVTYTMDPNCLEDAIKGQSGDERLKFSGRIKAVVPVHLYGHPADMQAIMDIVKRYDLYVIEDCAQSHGATIQGRKTGSWGDLAAFSFYPTKNLAAFGDGGMVVTDDPNLAERVRLLRQYGWQQRYVSEIAGANSRLDEIQAAILRVKLHYLDQENARRREIARNYACLLVDTDLALPNSRPGAEHIYHQYVVRTAERDALQTYLRDRGIVTSVHYPQTIHRQPAYTGRLITSGDLTHSERAAAQVLSLPMYPELSDEQVAVVADVINSWSRNA